MNTSLVANFPHEILAQMFNDTEALKSFFELMDRAYAEYQSKILNQYAEGGKEETESGQYENAINWFIQEVPSFKKLIEELPSGSDKTELHKQLFNMGKEMERRLGWKNKITAGDLIKKSLDSRSNNNKVEGIEALIEHIGSWFEEGHLGPGTVEFRGKKFTAS